jgi:hypothetical protein
MPKQTRSQALGNEGERWLAAQLPATWIPQLPTKDIGVDYLVVICDDGPLNGLEFRVQVKSAQRWASQDTFLIVKGFRTSNLLDLLRGFTPALLVLYESSTCTGYCYWLNQLLASDTNLLSSARKTVTLRVPRTRPISANLWQQIGTELRGVMSALGRRVALSQISIPILEASHQLMQSLYLIDLCAHGQGTRPDEEELLVAEVTAHKEIVTTLRTLDAHLAEIGGSIAGIKDVADRYLRTCETFCRNFQAFVDTTGQLELQVAPSELEKHRWEAFRAVTQVVSKLTMLSLQGAKAAATERLTTACSGPAGAGR